MTKKDYIRLANAMKNTKPTAIEEYSQWYYCVTTLANTLWEDNARFDYGKFIAACGVSHE